MKTQTESQEFNLVHSFRTIACDNSQLKNKPLISLHTYWCGHLHEHRLARIHAKANRLPAKWWMGFAFGQLHGKRQTYLSFGQLWQLRENNKQLNDVVSCPLWLQRGNGSTSPRPQLQMAHLYNHPLSFPQPWVYRDLGRSQRQINLEWKLLKCPQASKRCCLSGKSIVKTN